MVMQVKHPFRGMETVSSASQPDYVLMTAMKNQFRNILLITLILRNNLHAAF